MKTDRSITYVGWFVLILAAWDSRAIVPAWMHSPLDRFGWVALGIWVAPCLWLWHRGLAVGKWRSLWIGSSLAVLALGAISSLNTFGYLALALVIGSLPGFSWAACGWFICAMSWMPALSWAANAVPAPVLLGLRLFIALAGAFTLLFPTLRRSALDHACKTPASVPA